MASIGCGIWPFVEKALTYKKDKLDLNFVIPFNMYDINSYLCNTFLKSVFASKKTFSKIKEVFKSSPRHRV